MQAVILTAGRGRRMEPLSRSCHKALLEIGGMTILGRAIDSLVAAGINQITIVTGYRAADITGFVTQHYPSLPVRFVLNERYETTNNIVSLALALESLEDTDDVLLIECDLLFEPRLIKELIEHQAKNVALVDRYRTGMDGTVVTIDDNGYVSQVFPTVSQGRDFRYQNKFKTLNIYRFDRNFCQRTLRPMVSAYANHVDANCYYELVLGMLANVPEHRIAAQVVAESDWVEVDDPNDLNVARFAFDPNARSGLLDQAFGGHWAYGILDFSLPRNAHFPPPAMHAAMRYSLPDVITGYSSAQDVLDEKVSLFLGCDPAHVVLLSGASQAYPVLAQHYAGSRVAIPSPTFGEYGRAFPQAIRYADVPGSGTPDLAGMAADTDLFVAVNPNNPTGTTIASQALYELAAHTPQTTFLVDESFLPFSDEPSLITLLAEAPLSNVLVLASMGKALGVPGLRLGYCYSRNREMLESVRRSLPIWGVNSVAEFFLELLLKFRTDLQVSISETVAERERMRHVLAELSLVDRVFDSGGNFLLVTLKGSAGTAAAVRAALLAEYKIEVKDISAKFGDESARLRLSVRTRQDNDRLLLALKSIAATV
jgi:histidinol-phosphate/aromatic aminotransferase/cobyric acid decarboxylase-like protein/choline kinase